MRLLNPDTTVLAEVGEPKLDEMVVTGNPLKDAPM
jgi:hypothetical protein